MEEEISSGTKRGGGGGGGGMWVFIGWSYMSELLIIIMFGSWIFASFLIYPYVCNKNSCNWIFIIVIQLDRPKLRVSIETEGAVNLMTDIDLILCIRQKVMCSTLVKLITSFTWIKVSPENKDISSLWKIKYEKSGLLS